jgi:hypothetical protein
MRPLTCSPAHVEQHILAHSLGSALAAHILSNQPTTQPPLEDLTLEEIKHKMKTQFLFNTSALFMIGSPLGVFLHLNQAQLIARKVFVLLCLRKPSTKMILNY